jgi:DNA-binding CsgD family transcriptional regulator
LLSCSSRLDRVCGGEQHKIRDRPGPFGEPALLSKGMVEPMAQIDIEILQPFAARFLEGTNLTPAERAEVLRIAQGFACKDSASAAGVSPETIRARRKRIYRKLDVPGSAELLAKLLALSLKMLSKGEKLEARPVAAAAIGIQMPVQQPALR